MKKNMHRDLGKSVARFTAAVTAFKTTATKIILLLLITTAWFSMMSFTNDDTIIHNTAHHLAAGKQDKTPLNASSTADTCCKIKILKAENNAVRTGIMNAPSVAGNTAIILDESKTKQLRHTNLWISVAEADEEIRFNFQISQIYLSAEVSENTDIIMVEKYIQGMVAGLRHIDESTTAAADAEVTDRFMTAIFLVQMNYPVILVKADTEMMQAFDTANPIAVALPTKMICSNADAEMIRAFENVIQ